MDIVFDLNHSRFLTCLDTGGIAYYNYINNNSYNTNEKLTVINSNVVYSKVMLKDDSLYAISGKSINRIYTDLLPVQAPPNYWIKIGDYVQMGRYYNDPILWRCVDIDANGPLMLADKILAIKPFDAMGTHKYADGTVQYDQYRDRANYGSNI